MYKNKIIEMYPVANDTFSNVEFRDRVVGASTPSKDKINPALLQDIQTAASKAGVVVSITTAVSGHKKGTRHETGNAIDVAMINNQGWSNERVARKKGIYDDIERFVSELEKLGYKKNVGESGNPKVVLTFGFKNHHHHVHVSNTTSSSDSQITPISSGTILPSETKPDDLQTLLKNVDKFGGNFKRDVLKRLLSGSGLEGVVDLIKKESVTENNHQVIIEEIKRIKNLL